MKQSVLFLSMSTNKEKLMFCTHVTELDVVSVDGFAVVGWNSPPELKPVDVGRVRDAVQHLRADDFWLFGARALWHGHVVVGGPIAKADVVAR